MGCNNEQAPPRRGHGGKGRIPAPLRALTRRRSVSSRDRRGFGRQVRASRRRPHSRAEPQGGGSAAGRPWPVRARPAGPRRPLRRCSRAAPRPSLRQRLPQTGRGRPSGGITPPVPAPRCPPPVAAHRPGCRRSCPSCWAEPAAATAPAAAMAAATGPQGDEEEEEERRRLTWGARHVGRAARATRHIGAQPALAQPALGSPRRRRAAPRRRR